MAKMSKKETEAIIGGVLILLVIGAIVKFFEVVGFVVPIVVIVVAVILFFVIKSRNTKAKRERLMQKYGDEEIVERIMNQSIWQGQTQEQLTDTLGSPADVDQKVLKTKKKEIWKYGHQGANRYSTRITLENDVVIGWDVK